jgi:class 3 adenylate cyclase
MQAPWKLFPDEEPYALLTARQGLQEAVRDAWWEFYLPMSVVERAAWLDMQDAPFVWRQALASLVADMDAYASMSEEEKKQEYEESLRNLPVLEEEKPRKPARWWQWRQRRASEHDGV